MNLQNRKSYKHIKADVVFASMQKQHRLFLVCRLCIILLGLYELMVKIYIILTALFQLTNSQQTINK